VRLVTVLIVLFMSACGFGGAATVVNPSPPVVSNPPTPVPTPSPVSTPPPPAPAPVDSAVLSWNAPTQNIDNSVLTNLAGFHIHYWPETLYVADIIIDVPNPTVATYIIVGLASGTWHFDLTAYNTLGVDSTFSDEVTKVIL
jgi:hypothetical protein